MTLKIPALTSQSNLWTGITRGFDAYLVSRLVAEYKEKRSIIVCLNDEEELEIFIRFLEFFTPNIPFEKFLPLDTSPYDRVSPASFIRSKRLKCLYALAQSKKPLLLLTTTQAFSERLIPKHILLENVLTLKRGEEHPRDSLLKTLLHKGYIRTDVVHDPGEFAVRGSIVDIFPSGNASPIRLDFFGDTIDTLQYFDPITQRREASVDMADMLPPSEVVLTPSTITTFKHRYREAFGFDATKDFIYQNIDQNQFVQGIEHWLGFFYQEKTHLLDYVVDPLLIMPHTFYDTISGYSDYIEEQYTARKERLSLKEESPYRPLPPEDQYFGKDAIKNRLNKMMTLAFSPFSHREESAHFESTPPLFSSQLKEGVIQNFMEMVTKNQKPSALVYQTKDFTKNHRDLFQQDQTSEINDWNERGLQPSSLYLVQGNIPHGFEAPSFSLYTEQDLFGEKRVLRKKRKTFKEITLELLSYKPQDFIVHKEHGVGQFLSLVPITVNGITHDCVQILFAEEAKLYVPVENLDIISKYGESNTEVPLDKLGGTSWQKRKASAKKHLFEIAEKLIAIAAERLTRKGIQISYNPESYEAFASSFPYTETDDQANAIEDVIEDLSSHRPMDRLICGDVGFGKTEVAMRAAFLAAKNGYQVVLIAPTTILARQHYQSFEARMRPFGIRVAQLSRFLSAKEAKAVRDNLKEGKIDVLIATHSVFKSETKFHQLGLAIIDEEQHFGVNQKEHLKKMYPEINVLTMTATPIPRTLQMSLNGIRDMSLIATPPIDRLAVRTQVCPYDEVSIRDALLRESHRSGQSYFVCPRIKDVEKLLPRLKALVPEIKVEMAYGQMPPPQLQKIMEDFSDNRFDVLVSTNIVESGLDIPRANTMFIYNADLFGLSQLYQLRGRIGRSKQRGYAYFLLPEKRMPGSMAQKRLEVMQSLDGLGAGFALASHDMDIRGAGNLVGDDQSGHIKEVGVELYQQMLEEAVASMREDAPHNPATRGDWSPQINLDLPVFVPESYIADLPVRLAIYRRISALLTHEIRSFEEELQDRFGPPPKEVLNLLSVVKLKNAARAAHVEKIDVGPKGTLLTFHRNEFPFPQKLVTFLQASSGIVKLRTDQKMLLMRIWATPYETLEGLHDFLVNFAKTCME